MVIRDRNFKAYLVFATAIARITETAAYSSRARHGPRGPHHNQSRDSLEFICRQRPAALRQKRSSRLTQGRHRLANGRIVAELEPLAWLRQIWPGNMRDPVSTQRCRAIIFRSVLCVCQGCGSAILFSK
jgi:hypothetical protein